MEIEEVKKISRYDEYTVNEFVRGLVKARKDIEIAKEELATRADNVNAKLQDVENEITEEELKQNEEEIKNVKQERNRIEKIISKWEKEKERIIGRLTKKKEENENKIAENEQKLESLENEIKENEEKMNDLDQGSKEYEELKQSNVGIRGKISRTKGNITRYNNKKANIIEIIGNLETENVLEGLTPPRTIDRAKTLPGKNIRKLNEGKEKNEVIEEVPQKEEKNEVTEEQQKEEISNNEQAKEIAGLEEQIKKSAARMKEYRETGNYNQEALEHAYYNGLVSKLSSLKANNEKTVQENAKVVVDEPTQTKTEVKAEVEKNEIEKTTTKTEVEEPAQTAKATRTTVEQPAQTVKATRTTVEQPTQTVNTTSTQTIEPKQEINATKTQSATTINIQQIQENNANIAEKTDLNKATIEFDDNFEKNAFGWYFNPWIDEYDKDYDPHKDPWFNKQIKQVEKNNPEVHNEEKNNEKKSIMKKIREFFTKIKNDIKSTFSKQKKLPQTVTTDEKVINSEDERKKFAKEIHVDVVEKAVEQKDNLAKDEKNKDDERVP